MELLKKYTVIANTANINDLSLCDQMVAVHDKPYLLSAIKNPAQYVANMKRGYPDSLLREVRTHGYGVIPHEALKACLYINPRAISKLVDIPYDLQKIGLDYGGEISPTSEPSIQVEFLERGGKDTTIGSWCSEAQIWIISRDKRKIDKLAKVLTREAKLKAVELYGSSVIQKFKRASISEQMELMKDHGINYFAYIPHEDVLNYYFTETEKPNLNTKWGHVKYENSPIRQKLQQTTILYLRMKFPNAFTD